MSERRRKPLPLEIAAEVEEIIDATDQLRALLDNASTRTKRELRRRTRDSHDSWRTMIWKLEGFLKAIAAPTSAEREQT